MDDAVGVLLDPTSSDRAVLYAIELTRPGSETATLLSRVGNDATYRAFHRAAAVHELFRRHVETPVTLRSLALLLDGGQWLLDAAVETVELMAGEVPVRIPVGGVAFVIRLPQDDQNRCPEVGMYIAVNQVIGADELRRELTSSVTDNSSPEIRLVDIAPFPDRLRSTDFR